MRQPTVNLDGLISVFYLYAGIGAMLLVGHGVRILRQWIGR